MLNKKRLTLILLAVIIAFGFSVRTYHIGQSFFQCEMRSIISGFRLHLLDFFNLSAHLTENFFKSFLGDIVGTRYIIFTYLASGLYDILGIPYSEFWIFFIYAFLGTLSIALVYCIGRKLADDRVGLIAAALFTVNEYLIFMSRNDDGSITIPFFVALFHLLFLAYLKKPDWLLTLFFGIIMALMSTMETLAMIPLIAIYQFVLPYDGKKLLTLKNACLWLPTLLTVCLNYYIFLRIGISNLGLFGYMQLNYSGRVNFSTLFPVIGKVLTTYATHYFHPIVFILTLFIFMTLLVKHKFRFPNFAIRFSFIGVLYFFFLFIYVSSTLGRHIYLADVSNIIFFSAVWVTAIHELIRSLTPRLSSLLKTASYSLICLLILYQGSQVALVAWKRPILIHPFKSVGYYVREYGKNEAVYNLWDCHNICHHQFCEYYYGKQLMNPIYSGSPRRIFCIGNQGTIEETLRRYHLSDFAFYINVKYYYHLYKDGRKDILYIENEESKRRLEELKRLGLKKVAVIRHVDEILAEIYSRKKTPYMDLEVTEYDKLWDKKFANIANLLEGKWVGITSTWGERFSHATGF